MNEKSIIRLHLFGAPQVSVNEQTVHFTRKKSLAILIYLAVENKPISRETLGVMFWPESADSQQQVRIALSDIRKQLGNHIFLEQRNPVRVNPASLAVDVLRFHEFATTTGIQDTDLAEITDLIDHANDCFLSGFTLRDCPVFDAWLQLQEQVAIRDLQRCYHLVIQSLDKNANFEGAITLSRQLIHLDPYNEEHYRLLMRFHAKNRELHQVKKVYQWLKGTLEQELGVEPDQKTQAVYLQIQQDLQKPESTDQKKPDEVSYLGGIGRAQTIPYYGQPYFGRVEEQESIIQLLKDPVCRLISIIGMGGIGKTHLVSHLYPELTKLFPEGVYFIPLDSVADTSQFASEIANNLQIAQLGGETLPQVIGYLRSRRVLIILDNLEQLLPEVALIINNLVQLTDKPKFLITSRVKLQLHHEYSIILEGLNYPSPETPPLDVEALKSFNAMQLFLHWAKKKKSDFELNPQNANAVRTLCAQLEGLPLALRLAAAWVEVFSPTELVAEIHRNLAFVRDELHDTPVRHRSFRALFRSVWEQITAEEREAFIKLCIFRSGFTWRAASAITGTSARELKSLVDQSLLMPDPSRGNRYHIHEIFRFFGQRQQKIDDIQKPLQKQYVRYYAGFLGAEERDLKGGDQLEALARMDMEYDNIKKAWEIASRQGYLSLLDKMIAGLHLYIIFKNNWIDGRRLFEAALSVMPFGYDVVSKRVHGKLSSRFHFACFPQLHKLGKILQAARNNEDWPEVVYVSMEIGFTLWYLEYREIAILYFERAIKICQENSYIYEMGQAQHEIAEISILLDDLDCALLNAQKGLQDMEQIGDMHGAARTKILLGEISFFKGELDLALNYMNLAREEIQKYTGADSAIYIARILPWILFFSGDFEQSSRLASWLRRISQQDDLISLGDHLLATQLLGLNEYIQGCLERSQELFAKSFALLEDEKLLTTMRGQIQTDRHLFLLVKYAEALSYFLIGEDEKSKTIIDDLLGQPAVHKRPLLIKLLLALDVLLLDAKDGLESDELANWIGRLSWAAKIRNQRLGI
jgi:DNA-binding SARP family transcriptional activator/predicted ATPase